ncbi:TonB family protein [Hymenobacter sp. UYAg731]
MFVTFIVGKDGLVREVALLKGIQPLFDAEALRVVRALTGFTPGRQNGEAVAVTMNVPITFKSE